MKKNSYPSIFTVTSVQKDHLHTRTWGYFFTKAQALRSIMGQKKRGDPSLLNECGYYPYVVIEEMGPGLYNYSDKGYVQWLKWVPKLVRYRWKGHRLVSDKGRWVKCDVPQFAEGVCNFGIG